MKSEETFILQEKDKATLLCTRWHIGSNAEIVNNWIDIYIQGMKAGSRVADANKAIFVEHQLETIYRTSIVNADKILSYYLLARLLLYSNNVLSFGSTTCRIDSAYVQPLIKELIKSVRFTANDFLTLINNYLSPSWVYPQNDLSVKLIEIAKKSNLLSTKYNERHTVFISILKIIAKKGYHHDIIGFKKLLAFICIDDRELITCLRTYHVATRQGCFEMLNTMFNLTMHTDDGTDFIIKRHIIEVFDTAKGSNPSPLWKDKALDLTSSIPTNKLKGWCDMIINEDKWLYDTDTGWKDNVVTRFRKAALWMNMMLTNDSTALKVG